MYCPAPTVPTTSPGPGLLVDTVTDGEVEECVDPGGNEAILNVGEGWGPCPPGGGGNRQLASDSGGG